MNWKKLGEAIDNMSDEQLEQDVLVFSREFDNFSHVYNLELTLADPDNHPDLDKNQLFLEI